MELSIEHCSSDGQDNCVYFDASNKEKFALIKKMVKVQTESVCHGQLSFEFAKFSLNKMSRDEYKDESFGYFSYYPTSSTDMRRRSGRGYTNRLGGFVVCLVSNKQPKIGTVEILCSKNSSGVILLQNIEDKALGRNLSVIQLFALPQDRLKKWYQDRGYFISELPSSDGTYLAQKIIS